MKAILDKLGQHLTKAFGSITSDTGNCLSYRLLKFLTYFFPNFFLSNVNKISNA